MNPYMDLAGLGTPAHQSPAWRNEAFLLGGVGLEETVSTFPNTAGYLFTQVGVCLGGSEAIR